LSAQVLNDAVTIITQISVSFFNTMMLFIRTASICVDYTLHSLWENCLTVR